MAEGVENEGTAQWLKEFGCDVVQGYLISPPLEPHKLKHWRDEFRYRWPAMLEGEELALWRDFEPDSLR